MKMPVEAIPTIIPDLFNKLTQHDAHGVKEEILETIKVELANKGSETNRDPSISFLYDPEEFSKSIPLTPIYCLKRLLRGMASTSVTTRNNYASCLAFLIESVHLPSALKDPSVLWRWKERALDWDGVVSAMKLSSSENAARQTGQRLAELVLIACNPRHLGASSLSHLLFSIYSEQPSLGSHVLETIWKMVPEEDLKEALSNDYLTYKNSLDRSKLLNSLLEQAMGLTLAFAGLTMSTPPSLETITRTLEAITIGLFINPIVETWALAVLLSVDENRLKGCWLLICEKFALRPKLSDPVIASLFLRARSIRGDISSEVLINPYFIEFIDRNKGKMNFFETRQDRKLLLNAAINSKVPCKNLIPDLLVSLLPIEASVVDDNDRCPPSIALYLLSMMKPGSIYLSDMKQALVILESLWLCISSPSLSLEAQERIGETIQGVFTRILETKLVTFNDLLSENWNIANSLLAKNRFVTLDGARKDVFDQLKCYPSTIARVRGKSCLNDTIRNTALIDTAEAIFKICRLFFFIDPMASINIFPDLQHFFASHLGKHAPRKRDTTPILSEILIQWLSRPSSFLRICANDLIRNLTPYLTAECMESIEKILSTVPGTEKDDLMEEEVEEDEDDDDESLLEEASEGNDSGGLIEEEYDETGDEEDVGEESSTKRLKLLEAIESALGRNPPNSDAESDLGSEEKDIPIDEADENELNRLDEQLSSIMKARKGLKMSKNSSRQAIVHFKQRILGWLEIMFVKNGDGYPEVRLKQLILLKLQVLPAFLKLLQIHGRGASSEENKHRIDIDLVAKARSLFVSLFSKQLPTDIAAARSKRIKKQVKKTTAAILEIVCEFDTTIIPQIALALWYLASLQKKATSRSWMEELFKNVIVEGDKRHLPEFIGVYEEIRAHAPHLIVKVAAFQDVVSALPTIRPFSRQKVYKFLESALKRVDGSHPSSFIRFFKSMSSMFEDGLAEGGYLNTMRIHLLKEELAFLNTLISKSRFVIKAPHKESHWKPILDALERHFEKLKDTDPKQIESLKSRLKSMKSLAQPKK